MAEFSRILHRAADDVTTQGFDSSPKPPRDDVLLAELENPEFENAGRVHDWRNHVLDEVKEQWAQLSFDARKVAYLTACNEADNEEWD